MNILFRIIVFMMVLLPFNLFSQTDCTPSQDCENAPLLCGKQIESLTFTNAGSGSGGIFNFCGTLENTNYFKFVACGANLRIILSNTTCQVGNGMQMALLDGCNSSNLLTCSPGEIGGIFAPLVLSYPVQPGKEYIVLIDGYAGDVCEYTLDILSGIDANDPQTETLLQNGSISGDVTPCGIGQYTANLPVCSSSASAGCNSNADSIRIADCLTYFWELPQGAHIVSPDPSAATVVIQFDEAIINGVISVTPEWACSVPCPDCESGCQGTIPPLVVTSSPLVQNECADAPFLCAAFLETNTISNSCSFASNYVDNVCFPLDNNRLFRLSTCGDSLSLKAKVTNCTENRGLEFALLDGDCTQGLTALTCGDTIKKNQTKTLNYGNLLPQHTYYLLIDGLNYDQCDVKFEVEFGMSIDTIISQPNPPACLCTNGSIQGPATLCPGDVATYKLIDGSCTGGGTGGSFSPTLCNLPSGLCNPNPIDSFIVHWVIPAHATFVGANTGHQVKIKIDPTLIGTATNLNEEISVWLEHINLTPTNFNDSAAVLCNCQSILTTCHWEVNPMMVNISHTVSKTDKAKTCSEPCVIIGGNTYCNVGEFTYFQDNCETKKVNVTDEIPVLSITNLVRTNLGNGSYTVSFNFSPTNATITGGLGSQVGNLFTSAPIICGIDFNFVINVAGCQEVESVDGTLDCSAPTTIESLSSSNDSLTCNDPFSTIVCNVSAPNVFYNWTGPLGFTATSQQITIGQEGVYTVKIKDNLGVVLDEESITIAANLINPSVTNVQYQDLSDGNYTVTFNFEPLNVVINDINGTKTGNTFVSSPIPCGNRVDFEMSYGSCSAVGYVEFSCQAATISSLTATADTLTCSKTNSNITCVASATGVFYSWSGPGITANSTSQVSVSMPGVYTVKIKNDVGTVLDEKSITIVENIQKPVFTLGNDISFCQGTCDTIGLNNFPVGTTGVWNNGTTQSTLKVCAASTYMLTLTNTGNGCSASDTLAVSVSSIAVTDLGEIGKLSCTQPCLTFMGINCCEAKVYEIPGDCKVTKFSVGADQSLTIIDLGVVDTVDCTQPCTTYLGENFCQAGSYQRTIGCEIRKFTIAIDSILPVIDLGLVGTLTCLQPSVTYLGENFTVSGTFERTINCEIKKFTIDLDTVLPIIELGLVGTLNCNQPSFTYLGENFTIAGTYERTINCEINKFTIDLDNTLPIIDLGVVDTLNCLEPTFTFLGETFTEAGDYERTVDCEIKKFSIAIDSSLPINDLGVIGTLDCKQPTLTYLGENFTTAGDYERTIDCEIKKFSIAIDSILPIIELGIIGTLDCSNSSVTYLGENFIYAGDYERTVDCEIKKFSVAIDNTLPINDLGIVGTLTCADKCVTFLGESFYDAGIYDRVDDCEVKKFTIAIDNVSPTSLEIELNAANCPENPIGSFVVKSVEGGKEPYLYSLDASALQSKTLFDYLQPGDYTVEVEDANGCTFSKVVSMPTPLENWVYIGEDTTLISGASLMLKAETNMDPFKIVWKDNFGNKLADTLNWKVFPSGNGAYFCEIIDSNGCKAKDIRNVSLEDRQLIFVPNVVNYGNVNSNDYFSIFAAPGYIEKITSMNVYDRWGDCVYLKENFHANDPLSGWNGLARDKVAAEGVYFYHAKVVLYTGEIVNLKGDFTLIR
jgi:hypothetical protein